MYPSREPNVRMRPDELPGRTPKLAGSVSVPISYRARDASHPALTPTARADNITAADTLSPAHVRLSGTLQARTGKKSAPRQAAPGSRAREARSTP